MRRRALKADLERLESGEAHTTPEWESFAQDDFTDAAMVLPQPLDRVEELTYIKETFAAGRKHGLVSAIEQKLADRVDKVCGVGAELRKAEEECKKQL